MYDLVLILLKQEYKYSIKVIIFLTFFYKNSGMREYIFIPLYFIGSYKLINIVTSIKYPSFTKT